MTEKSFFWTTGTVGDGALPYTQNELHGMFKTWFNGRIMNGRGGVLQSPVITAALGVTGTASPLSVDIGNAIVAGIPYRSLLQKFVTIPTPVNGTTGHCIVLRANWTTQTVRITLISSADGVADEPAITQSIGSIYDTKLAYVTMTTLGVATVTDRREFLVFNSLWLRHQGGDLKDWTSPGSTRNTAKAPTIAQTGAAQWTGSASSGSVVVTFPEPYYSSTKPAGLVQVLTKTGITTQFLAIDNTQATISWASAGVETSLDFTWVSFGLIGEEG